MNRQIRPSTATCAVLLANCLVPLSFPQACRGEAWLVKEGQPQAEIVIAEHPPRMVKLAAEELQTYIERISGARLPIVTAPSQDAQSQVYVGASRYTDQLKITDDGLAHGAFRIASEKSHLVLLGHDSDFTPPKFFLKSPGDLPEFLKEWDAATGEHWGFANGNLYKEFNGELKIWSRDERGSLNAVYEFLRMLGVRWYLPGTLGEIVPETRTIKLPEIDKTIHPDFALRFPYQYARMFGHEPATRDEVLWQLRLGWNQAADVIGDFGMGLSHGMNSVYERSEVHDAHPEYYVLVNGRRDGLKVGECRPCLSSPGLFHQNVKYARTMFDLLDAPLVSLMPQDGYGILCECELCRGKNTLARGGEGHLSDYVWDYVDRVAREVYQTHPQKKVNCYAYGAYLLPPQKIDQLSPNLIVGICQNRSQFGDPVERQKFAELRQAWLAKMPNDHKQLVINDYYLHARSFTLPHVPYYFPRAIAEDLRALKGISIGDFIEVYRDLHGIESLAVDHLNLYVTSRYWWDADQNIDALLDEYCAEFYGPAAGEMKAFIDYCEAHLRELAKNTETIDQMFALLEKAQAKAPADSVYAKRMAFVAEYILPMKDLREQLARGRGDVPEAAAFERDRGEFKLDGQLDDKFWEGAWVYDLSDLETGKAPYMTTSFKMGWADKAIYFGIRCEDRDTKKLNIATTRHEDPNLWNGDCVEIELETQNHAYYQFAINPAAALIDLDRQKGIDTLWSSGAEVATHVGDGFWSAEVRIPVVGEEQAVLNPQFGVAGRKPSQNYPWYFNVCRQRMRLEENEYSAFSPTSTSSFHILKKFAKLHVR